MKALLIAGVAALSLSAAFFTPAAEASAPSAPPACLKCWGYIVPPGCINFRCVTSAPGPGAPTCVVLATPCNWSCTTSGNPVCL